MAWNYGMSKIFGIQRTKEIQTRIHFHKKIDLSCPRKLNEKILWTEYNTDGKMRSLLTDKYEVRKFVEQKGYKDTLVPLLGVYDKAEEVSFDGLPKKFVLKATHGCDMNYICVDKNKLDKKEKEVIMLRFYKEKTQSQVAKILGITQVQVSRIERRILNSMKLKLTS